jgi:hypothetical protein
MFDSSAGGTRQIKRAALSIAVFRAEAEVHARLIEQCAMPCAGGWRTDGTPDEA